MTFDRARATLCRAVSLFPPVGHVWVLALSATAVVAVHPVAAQSSESLTVPGLEQPVEILKDQWGISHIYAETEHDLFFAQGYSAARDRLFQFEIWRAQATGTTAEILGPREVERDRGTRLFKFRGDLTQELRRYHPRGDQIVTAYVDGVNAYIAEALEHPDDLPLPFRLLGIQPKPWTPEVVISRHQGLLGNIGEELQTGRAVCRIGGDAMKELVYYHPHEPDLELDDAIDCASLLDNDILGVYDAFRGPLDFRPQDIVAANDRNDEESYDKLAAVMSEERQQIELEERDDIGSNNWVVSGALTQDGYPYMINDPHRAQSVPSLRYWVHLVGPGWNVIGGGEPEIPGVSIGHNEFGAWGLTVFGTDGEDLYVYQTNPSNPNQYRYEGRWEDMEIIADTIPVKGARPVPVVLKYTRHGPVVFEDTDKHLAYAVRAAWMEPGSAPYLASLRMDQARTWDEFREACNFSNIPGENMVWADREGNIGWQAVGIAPIRRNFSGMVPVPGDGRFEWDGYLPIKAKPHDLNPDRGFIETSNSNYTSPDYPYMDAIGYTWTDPYRWARASEVLGSGRKFNLMDMVRLQHDYLSIPARTIVPMLADLKADDPQVEEARKRLLDWDYVLDKGSVTAGIYAMFERRLLDDVEEVEVPEQVRDYVRIGMKKAIDFLMSPDGDFGDDPLQGRDALLLRSLAEAVQDLRDKLGPDMDEWVYGQAAYKHVTIRHPLSPAVDARTRDMLDVGPAPRGGDGFTIGNTGGSDNQTTGASFRIFVDTRDWDNTLGMNTPGQVGDPESPFYENLFDLWANDKVFPAFYSRPKVEGVTAQRLELTPGG